MFFPLTLLAGCLLPGQVSVDEGTIGGVVVRASDQSPVAGAEVVLRRYADGSFLPVAKCTTDAEGKYFFRKLPLDGAVYLPGANHGGVHYPGEKARLTPRQPVAGIKLEVCDPLKEPDPLVIRRHDIVIEPMPGKVWVREVLQIDNPTSMTYVGKPAESAAEPVTLQLSIPSDFVRVTFDKEFYGRRFSVHGGKLITSIPWTPGSRELGLTYVLPNDKDYYIWQRPVDLPSALVRIVTRVEDPNAVTCSLGTRSSPSGGEVVFSSVPQMPAGEVIRVEIGRLPVPAIAYARWAALVLLAAAIAMAAVTLRNRRADCSQNLAVLARRHHRGKRHQDRAPSNHY
jgi:hypothetical protein